MKKRAHELQKSVIGEWLVVKGEVVPFGPIVYAFGEETNPHSTKNGPQITPITIHPSFRKR